MLHWLAGQKQTDVPTDPDATGYVDPPETPAPVFAVRAFKHAIFGTPQTTQPRPRRHSNAENGKPGLLETKSARPGISRPKSSSDAPTVARQELHIDVEPLSSPAKGILLSPGTGTARKKNVTFHGNVVDNEEKRPMRSGQGDESPAKFPGAWVPASESPQKRDESPSKSRGRTKLAEALEQARDESKRGKSKAEKRGKTASGDDAPPKEFASPKSESGKYWKREYDIYRTNTQHEVKKLITKQKAAKSFAQMKDEQCTELADELKEEQKKVEKLESRTAELASLIEDLQTQLRVSKEAERSHRKEISRLKGAAHGQGSRPTIGVPEPLFDHHRSENGNEAVEAKESESAAKIGSKARHLRRLDDLDSRQHNVGSAENDPVQRPSQPYKVSTLSRSEKPERRKADSAQMPTEVDGVKSTTSSDHIWAQSFASSSVIASRAAEKPSRNRTGQEALGETSANPLQSLDLNALSNNAQATQIPVQPRQLPALPPKTSSTKSAEFGHDPVTDTEPENPFVSARVSRLLSDAKASQVSSTITNAGAGTDNATMNNQQPSWLHTDSASRSQRNPAPQSSTQPPSSREDLATNTKENVPPDPPPHSDLKAKPSTIWNSMSGSSAGKRNVSLTGKDGKEVSMDRIEAARARIAARSRGTLGA